MITYRNDYYANGKHYADIIAKENDVILVEDLGNGSTLRILDATSPVLMYYDEEEGLFRQSDNGKTGRYGYLTGLPTTTFTIENTGGTNRQRFADAPYFAEETLYYFVVEMPGLSRTFKVTGEKDDSGNMVYNTQGLGQIVANVAESEAYGEPGLYIVSPMLDMAAGNEMSIKIYVSALGLMDKYGH